MATRPTISVIIPAHPARCANGMLDRALRSVQAQTVLPNEIHVRIDVDGEGAAPTRHKALQRATTDWVAFLDSDDIFKPDHLRKLLVHALEADADFVYSWYELLTNNPDGTFRLWGDKDPIMPPTHFSEPFDPKNPIETTITTLVRRELAQEVGFAVLDRGGVNSGEDARFTLECLAHGARISHLAERTWIWAHHGHNTSGFPTKGDGILVGQ